MTSGVGLIMAWGGAASAVPLAAMNVRLSEASSRLGSSLR
jgi:hypothetical protein